ncbi:MAG: hypothetical protein [Microviridae sp.]|nr:MAG: hypothetical protein [Microviridae sp.]
MRSTSTTSWQSSKKPVSWEPAPEHASRYSASSTTSISRPCKMPSSTWSNNSCRFQAKSGIVSKTTRHSSSVSRMTPPTLRRRPKWASWRLWYPSYSSRTPRRPRRLRRLPSPRKTHQKTRRKVRSPRSLSM